MSTAGRFAAKRIAGQTVTVEADAYADGHDVLAVELLWKAADENEWQRTPMASLGNARWQARFTPFRVGRYQYTVEAWIDEYATLCRAIRLKRDAGVDINVELEEVRLALEAAIARKSCTRSGLSDTLATLKKGDVEASVQALISPETRNVVAGSGERHFLARHAPLNLEVEREAAGFAAWYELFPRSLTEDPKRHGTFNDVIAHLPRVRDMGFDVLYFPPIHPIGSKARKGKQQQPDRRARGCRQPLRDRQPRGRARRAASGARHVRGFPPPGRRGARARAGDRASTSPSSARPTIRG